MDPKRRKQAKTSFGVPTDGPQTPKTRKNVFWGAGGWTSNAENGQNRRLRCQRMDLKRRKQVKPSSEVPSDGPQTPKMGENVPWGASRWTPNDGNGRNRRLGCQRMDPKHRKRAKPSSEVPVNGPQAMERGRKRFWRGWKGGIGGKGQVGGEGCSGKMCHPRHHKREGPASEAQWEGSRSDFFRSIPLHRPSNSAYYRRLGCRRMDLKRRKSQKNYKSILFFNKSFLYLR